MSAVVLKRGTIIPSLEISMSQVVEDMTTFKVYRNKISAMEMLMQELLIGLVELREIVHKISRS